MASVSAVPPTGNNRRTAADDGLTAQYTRVLGAVALYWAVSISMVFLNKTLLSDTVDAPLFVTWYQCLVSVLLCALFGWLAKLMPHKISFPEFKLDQKLSREVLPLSFVFVGMITFNNLCLRNVGVAFYYVGRSLTTVFNVVCVYIIMGERTAMAALFWCAVIIAGFFFGVDQEGMSGWGWGGDEHGCFIRCSLSVSGVVFGVLASLCVALNAIYTKKTLPSVGDSIWRLTLYNNLNALVVFLPFIIANGDIAVLLRYDKLFSPGFWLMLSLSGVLGFGMGYVTGLQIQVTSPLTHNISGTAKAAAQTVMAVVVYDEIKVGHGWHYIVDLEIETTMWWLSNLVVLVGSAGYTYTKHRLMQSAHQQSLRPGPSGVSVDKQPLIKTSDQEDDEDVV